ncbi:Cloroperoxidase [Aspergillus ambiguus]|uniref:peroxidase family protein n=1 Tax=Aspergillus ambiguus TaxID=176160 RepID=UPI003CCDC2BF
MARSSYLAKKYEYHAAGAEDLRGPCPVLNALANHGLISRDGRNITADQLKDALKNIGVGIDIRLGLVKAAYAVHDEHSHRGLRNPGQVNNSGTPVLNLDQTGRPHAVEHDVSLSREDRALGDSVNPHPGLVEGFLGYPPQDFFSVSHFGRFRKKRYLEQKAKNKDLDFSYKTHIVACAEAAIFQGVFGEGVFRRLPVEYAKAVFQEERLPLNEGWRPRWIPLMISELIILVLAILYYASSF